ncbi:MAG: hypothetical protein ACKVHO_01815 [Verrucomicrobiia bacterium]
MAAEQTIGVLLLGTNEPRPLNHEELKIGNEIGRSLAVTLNLANLFIEVNDARVSSRVVFSTFRKKNAVSFPENCTMKSASISPA